MKNEGEPEIRTLKAIDVSEVSILSVNPAYIATSIAVRADDCEELTECRADDSRLCGVQYDIEERQGGDDMSKNEAFREVVESLKK